MDELKQLAKLRMAQDQKRKIEQIDKPQFRLADPNQPTKLRTRPTSAASMGLPPIEDLLNPEQINDINKNWDHDKQWKIADQLKQDGLAQGSSLGLSDENANSTYKPLPMEQVLANLDEIPDEQLETEVGDYVHGNRFKGKDVKALDAYLAKRNQDMKFAEPDLQDDDNYFFDLYGDNQ